jgi:hypothetical protein
MSTTDTLPAQIPSDGVKGLAMMVPALGLPLIIHALSGVVISGVGFAAITSVMSPFRSQILQAVKVKSARSPVEESKAVPASPVPEPVLVTESDQELNSELL